MVSWEKTAETLSGHISDETGIQTDEVDFTFITEDGTLKVKLNSYDFAQIEYKGDDSDEGNMADEIIKSISDLKQKLVEIKISQLGEILLEIVEHIKLTLRNKNIPEETISSLNFGIIDTGYHLTIQGMADEEATSGYPDIVLIITNPAGLDYSYPLNIYYPDAPVDDIGDLISGLLETNFR
jgi:hypothetical protein